MAAAVHDRVTGVVFACCLALWHRVEVVVAAARLVRALPLPRVVATCRAERVVALV